MPGFKLAEELSRWASFPFFRVLQTLADAFVRVGAGGNVEKVLIGFGILHDGGCFSLHGKHHGALALFQMFHEVAGAAAEGRQRLDVFGDVEHGIAPVKHLFRCC